MRSIFSATLVFMLFSYPVFAQSQLSLFETQEQTIITRDMPDAVQLSDHEIRQAQITLNREALSQVRIKDRVSADLFGESYEFTVSRVTQHPHGAETLISRSAENEQQFFIGSWSNGNFMGNVLDYDQNRFYTIRYDYETGEQKLQEISFAEMDVIACDISEVLEIQNEIEREWDENPALRQNNVPQLPRPVLQDERTEIDVLLVYTPAAASWSNSFEGSIENSVALMMGMSQLAMDLSETNIDFRLVGLREVNYTDDTNSDISSVTHLRRFTSSPSFSLGSDYDGFMNEVHTWRDNYGADLVAMLARVSDVGGLAWLLNSTNGRDEFAFSLNRIQQLTTSFTLVHELGHNMGSHHSRNQNQNPANTNNAIFEYSTGWRWNGDNGASYASVMTYDEGSIPAPLFSNPDVMWGGAPSGTQTEADSPGPANNAESLRNIKDVISAYRPTVVDPPVFSSDPLIVANLDNNETETVTFTITNQGESRLNWTASLEADEGQYGAGSVLNEVQFSQDEGFETGSYNGHNGWVLLGEVGEFEISDDNPVSGNQHLRIPPAGASTWLGVGSPFYFNLNGPVEYSFDIYMRENPLFLLRIPKPNSRGMDVYLRPGEFDVRMRENQEDVLTWNTRHSFTRDGWVPVQLVMLPGQNEIILRYDGQEVFRTETEGFDLDAPRRLSFYLLGTNNSFLPTDIDNLVMRTFDASMEWISPLSKNTGTLGPGESKEITFDIRAGNLPPDLYEKNLVFETNDPENRIVTIPVNLFTEGFTSADEPEHPQSVSLSQNYPNPFNPTTQITFSLNETADVNLEVYNIQGQRVATLANDTFSAGSHHVTFDASHLSSGVYIYRLHAGGQVLSRKMILIK